MNKIKKIIFISIVALLIANTNLIIAQEYTVYEGPSDIQEEIESEGNYQQDEEGNYEIQYIETRDELEAGLFEKIVNSVENKNGEIKYNYLDYTSWHFWFLIIIILLIIFTTIKFLKQLKKINKKIQRQDNIISEQKKLIETNDVKEGDEIIYE